MCIMRHIVLVSSANAIIVVATFCCYSLSTFFAAININWTNRICAETLTRVNKKAQSTHTNTSADAHKQKMWHVERSMATLALCLSLL